MTQIPHLLRLLHIWLVPGHLCPWTPEGATTSCCCRLSGLGNWPFALGLQLMFRTSGQLYAWQRRPPSALCKSASCWSVNSSVMRSLSTSDEIDCNSSTLISPKYSYNNPPILSDDFLSASCSQQHGGYVFVLDRSRRCSQNCWNHHCPKFHLPIALILRLQ